MKKHLFIMLTVGLVLFMLVACGDRGVSDSYQSGANQTDNGNNSQPGTPYAEMPPPNIPQTPDEPVQGFADISMISSGFTHSLALRADGTVWAWGFSGFLGNTADTTHQSSPLQVLGGESGSPYLSDIVAISVGESHSLALRSDGTVWSWGFGEYGQLGIGTTYNELTPVQVLGGESGGAYLTDIIAVSAGLWHSLALRADGTVWTWGFNRHGQLGNQATVPRENELLPIQVVGGATEEAFLTDIIAISAGDNHNLVLRADGTVWAWGCRRNFQHGGLPPQTYSITNSAVTIPIQVGSGGGVIDDEFLTDIIAISAGDAHSMALRADGTVWGWGGSSAQSRPRQVFSDANGDTPLTDIIAISAGGHSMALRADGTVLAFGSNTRGQIGLGDVPARQVTSPAQVLVDPAEGTYLSGVIAISAGPHASLVLMYDGTVWEWGGRGASFDLSPSPAQVK